MTKTPGALATLAIDETEKTTPSQATAKITRPRKTGAAQAAPQNFEGISRQLQATSSTFAKQAGMW